MDKYTQISNLITNISFALIYLYVQVLAQMIHFSFSFSAMFESLSWFQVSAEVVNYVYAADK